MTIYVRDWECGMCGGPVYFDDVEGIILCRCGERRVTVPPPPKDAVVLRTNYHVATIKEIDQLKEAGDFAVIKKDRCFG